MSPTVELTGSAYLQTGVVSLNQVGELTAKIVAARHSFEVTPVKHTEGWRIKIRIDLQGDASLTLIQELKETGHFP